jgi:hypothetical protein
MSIGDHFDYTPDAAFVRVYDARAARRQFQSSVVLVLILAVVAFVLAILVRFDLPTSQIPLAPPKAETPKIERSHFSILAIAQLEIPGA